MNNSVSEPMVPYSVMKIVNGFHEPLRSSVLDDIQTRMARGEIDIATISDVQQAITRAFGRWQTSMSKVPNAELHKASIREFEAGEFSDIEELIRDLEGAGSQ